MGHRSKLAGALTVAVVAVLPADASACSCAPATAEAQLARADRAVIAKLIDVRVQGEEEFGYAPAVFVYRLRRVFKGPDRLRSRRRIRVHSNNQGSACGLPQQRKRYGLFLDRDRRGRLSSSLCSVTSPRSMRRAAREQGSRLAVARAATCRTSRT